MSRTLPKLVIALTHNFDAWIVGGAANPTRTEPQRDYDVVVPFSEWRRAAHLIPSDAKPTAFGGWKCVSEEHVVDVWPGELGWIMQRPGCVYAWHPASGVRIQRIACAEQNNR